MRMKSYVIKMIMAVCILVSIGLFIYLYEDEDYQIEEGITTENNMDSWTLEQSVLNGAPLEENKNVYLEEEPGKLNKIYITVFPTKDDEGSLLDLSAFDLHTARNKDYNPLLDANVQFGDENGELSDLVNFDLINASIRVRGNSARGASYKSYKVKLKDGAETLDGQTVLNINKHTNDISKITNKFCMDIMKPINDLASFRTSFLLVYIRDASLPKEEQVYEYYGLYTHVEQPNKSYLRERGFDEKGTLYKANNFEFRITPELVNVDDPSYSEESFETVLRIREGNDHTKLIQMLEDINNMNLDFNQVFAKYFNEDNYLTWMASNILLGNEDTIAHNFVLYNPQNALTWYLLPWDYDGTFKFGDYDSSFSAPNSLKGIQRMTGVLLHRRYFKQSGNIDKLTAKMEELLATAFTEEKVNALLETYKPVLEATMTKLPDVMLSEMPPNEYNSYLDQFDEQIQLNYEKYMNSLEYSMPMFVSEPVQNEDGTAEFAWEASYDYQGDLVTYGVTLARDYQMEDVVFEVKELAENQYNYQEAIPPGTYYLAIKATDRDGHTQCSLDYYSNETDFIYKFGVREVIIE